MEIHTFHDSSSEVKKHNRNGSYTSFTYQFELLSYKIQFTRESQHVGSGGAAEEESHYREGR